MSNITEMQVEYIFRAISFGRVELSERAEPLREYSSLYLSHMNNTPVKQALLCSAIKLIELFNAERILNAK